MDEDIHRLPIETPNIDLSGCSDCEVVITMTKGAEGQRTKDEIIRMIQNLPAEIEWGYSLVVAKK